MNPTLLAGVLALFTAIAAAAGTYMIARRRSSGQIATSDAATLWHESQAMRADLRSEVIGLRSEVLSLRTEVHTSKAERDRLADEVAGLRGEIRTLNTTIGELRRRLGESDGH